MRAVVHPLVSPVLAGLLLVLPAGCGVVPPDARLAPTLTACPTALLEGTLVRAGGGLGVEGTDDRITLVEWPDGWAVRDVDGRLALVDASGTVVAREGMHVEAGGGMNLDDTAFIPCGPIEFVPAR